MKLSFRNQLLFMPADRVAPVMLLCLPVVLVIGYLALQLRLRPELATGAAFGLWALVCGAYSWRRSRFHQRLWKRQYLICPMCDYELGDVESICPECGEPFTREGVIRFWRTLEEKAKSRSED